MPALKSASGLLPSAAENCFIRSSRDRASSWSTSSRTLFCTDAVLPSEKSFSSSRAELAVLRPEHLVDAVVEELGELARAVRELVPFSSCAAFSNSAFTNSAFAPACSRSSTRAPISTASSTVRTGSSPVLLALADEPDGAFVVDRQAVDRDPVAHHADVRLPEWSCSFHVD